MKKSLLSKVLWTIGLLSAILVPAISRILNNDTIAIVYGTIILTTGLSTALYVIWND